MIYYLDNILNESNTFSLFLFNMRSLKYIDINNVFEEVFGYSKNEVVGKCVFDLQIVNNKVLINIIKEVKTKKKYECILNGKSKINNNFCINLMSQEIKIDGKSYFLGITNICSNNIVKQEKSCVVNSSKQLSCNIIESMSFNSIKTVDPKMASLFKYIEAVSNSSQPFLITGETGTGKELIAHSIHKSSNKKGKLITVNIAGLEDEIISDTLFGHTSGAFTGSKGARLGLIEKAENGTLFLDEIGDLSMSSQIKLLRLLEEGEYRPVGADFIKHSNCRIITATSRPISELKDKRVFRKDLFYRLKMHQVNIPPLRERKGDLPVLIEHFLKSASNELNKNIFSFNTNILEVFSTYPFEGNVRELKGIIFNAVALEKNDILNPSSVKVAIKIAGECETDVSIRDNDLYKNSIQLPTLKESKLLLLNEALNRSGGNKTLAAKMLGVTPSAIIQQLNKHFR